MSKVSFQEWRDGYDTENVSFYSFLGSIVVTAIASVLFLDNSNIGQNPIKVFLLIIIGLAFFGIMFFIIRPILMYIMYIMENNK